MTLPLHANTNDYRIRPAMERGHTDAGWLDSRHSFSFGEYHDPAHMGFRSLRVINEDRVEGGHGFPTHPHRDMEIFSYVVSGQLAHKDSLGNTRTLNPGEIQLMSAGKGVEHSEFNPNTNASTHFLQIWIQPRARGLEPRYTEWRPTKDQEESPKVLVISPDGRERSATIQQDAFVYRIRLPAGASVQHELADGRGLWLQVIRGTALLDGRSLKAGDGARRESPGTCSLTAGEAFEGLLFDLR